MAVRHTTALAGSDRASIFPVSMKPEKIQKIKMDNRQAEDSHKAASESKDWRKLARNSFLAKSLRQSLAIRDKLSKSQKQHRNDKYITVAAATDFEERELVDPLTGLCDSRSFEKFFTYEIKRAKRYRRPLSILVLAIDDLESISKQHGSSYSDECLKAVSRVVLSSIRDVDIPGRISDQQLAILCPETYSTRALVVAERIRAALQKQSLGDDLKGWHITASIGIATFPSHARDAQELIEKAKQCQKKAEAAGGDCAITT